ncbi:MAG: hypothetical protein ACRYGM_25845 [Janthinobacterium lividum]
MGAPARASLLRVAMAFAVALVFAPAVRGVSIELNHSLGRLWPFLHSHCHAGDTPGCEAYAAATPGPSGRLMATMILP